MDDDNPPTEEEPNFLEQLQEEAKTLTPATAQVWREKAKAFESPVSEYHETGAVADLSINQIHTEYCTTKIAPTYIGCRRAPEVITPVFGRLNRPEAALYKYVTELYFTGTTALADRNPNWQKYLKPFQKHIFQYVAVTDPIRTDKEEQFHNTCIQMVGMFEVKQGILPELSREGLDLKIAFEGKQAVSLQPDLQQEIIRSGLDPKVYNPYQLDLPLALLQFLEDQTQAEETQDPEDQEFQGILVSSPPAPAQEEDKEDPFVLVEKPQELDSSSLSNKIQGLIKEAQQPVQSSQSAERRRLPFYATPYPYNNDVTQRLEGTRTPPGAITVTSPPPGVAAMEPWEPTSMRTIPSIFETPVTQIPSEVQMQTTQPACDRHGSTRSRSRDALDATSPDGDKAPAKSSPSTIL